MGGVEYFLQTRCNCCVSISSHENEAQEADEHVFNEWKET